MYNCDCVEYMRSLPDKTFDLAIADPPYGDAAVNEGVSPPPIYCVNDRNTTGSAGCSTPIKPVSRTGGTWAAKYSKKS